MKDINLSVKNRKMKLRVNDIICLVCAAVLCAIPFVPFVDEMQNSLGVVDGELDLVVELNAHLVMRTAWYGYGTIITAILIVISIITRNKIIRLVMIGVDVISTVCLVVIANKLVARIFTGYEYLYEPAAGYYMLLAASSILIIITLITIMKEKNASTAKQKEDLKDKADDKLEARDEGDK